MVIKKGLVYLLVKNPEKAQLIQPPMTIIGRTLVMLPFIMSVIIVGSDKGMINMMKLQFHVFHT